MGLRRDADAKPNSVRKDCMHHVFNAGETDAARIRKMVPYQVLASGKHRVQFVDAVLGARAARPGACLV